MSGSNLLILSLVLALLHHRNYYVFQESFRCCIIWFSPVYLYGSEKVSCYSKLLKINRDWQSLELKSYQVKHWYQCKNGQEIFLSHVCHKSTFQLLIKQFNLENSLHLAKIFLEISTHFFIASTEKKNLWSSGLPLLISLSL